MDSQAWMAGIDANRPAPMRFQHDQDISAGYMHSGYPIMTFMDVVNSTLDINGDHWVSWRRRAYAFLYTHTQTFGMLEAYENYCEFEVVVGFRLHL
jgi:hypothetical protein